MRAVSRLGQALRGSAGRNLVKVTAYSVVCLLVLAALVGRIGNIEWFAARDDYQAVLPDVTGLHVNDEVKVAGVPVGKVTGISVERGQAIVSFEVKPEIRLRRSTQVGIRWRNVLGQKYLYLFPGTEGPTLRPGQRLSIDRAVRSADVGEFLNAVAPILRAIDPAKANAFVRAFNEALDQNEDKVRRLLADSGTIAKDLGGQDREIGRLIENMDTVVTSLAERDRDLNTAVTRFRELASSLAANNEDLQLLVDRFAEVQTRLNQLVTENRGDLDATISDLLVIAGVLGEHRAEIDEALATLPQGLRVYDAISSYGQWFQIRITVSCLANQLRCEHETATTEALSGGSAESPDLSAVPAFALSGGGL